MSKELKELGALQEIVDAIKFREYFTDSQRPAKVKKLRILNESTLYFQVGKQTVFLDANDLQRAFSELESEVLTKEGN